jgi:hypothetical protein
VIVVLLVGGLWLGTCFDAQVRRASIPWDGTSWWGDGAAMLNGLGTWGGILVVLDAGMPADRRLRLPPAGVC